MHGAPLASSSARVLTKNRVAMPPVGHTGRNHTCRMPPPAKAFRGLRGRMHTTTADMILPTTITGSLPRPAWFTENLGGRPFRDALADATFREQYTDAVGTHLRDQERAGLDIVTDGDARFDNDVGGMSWFRYPAQ